MTWINSWAYYLAFYIVRNMVPKSWRISAAVPTPNTHMHTHTCIHTHAHIHTEFGACLGRRPSSPDLDFDVVLSGFFLEISLILTQRTILVYETWFFSCQDCCHSEFLYYRVLFYRTLGIQNLMRDSLLTFGGGQTITQVICTHILVLDCSIIQPELELGLLKSNILLCFIFLQFHF